MPSLAGRSVCLIGASLLVVAGFVAPNQPEAFYGGGACQLAPCGALEDPAVWRAMWWLWGCGAAVLSAGVVMVLRQLPDGPLPRVRGRRWPLAAFLVVLSWVGMLGAVFMLGVMGSAQAAAAVPVAGGPPLTLAIHTALFGGSTAPTRRSALAAAAGATVPLLLTGYLLLA